MTTVPKEFECPICFKLLYRPVTTACGHNFCKDCVDRVTAYNANCPLCRTPMSLEYAPNTLLTQIIRDMFADEMRERESEEMETAQSNDVVYRQACNESYNGTGMLPVIYNDCREPPIFKNEGFSFVVNDVDMSRLLKFAMTRDGRLISMGRNGTKQYSVGILLKIVDTHISHYISDDSHIPFSVKTVASERVELLGEATSTPYSWCTSRYKIVHDEFVFPQTDNRNEGETLDDLNESITRKALSGDSLVPEYVIIKELTEKQITDMDRYKLCCHLMKICNVIAKRQLKTCSHAARQLFTSRFTALPASSEVPTSKEVESNSLFYARLVRAKAAKKWDWYSMRDPLKRLVEVASVYAYAGDACVLQLENTSMLDLGTLWVSLFILLVVLIIPGVMRQGRDELRFLML